VFLVGILHLLTSDDSFYKFREPSNQVVDQEDWDEDVADEVIEMREQAEEEFQHQLKQYNEQYSLWQEQKQRKVTNWLNNLVTIMPCAGSRT